MSQGYIRTTRNNYLVHASTSGSFELTEIALNVTQPLTEQLRMGAQIFTSQIGGAGDFKMQADWYYLDYRLADWLGVRAGRTKLPFGLYNEINDIDAARVPILLPQAVYPLLNRDLLLAQTGLELYGYLGLGAGGGVEYRLYGGTIFWPTPSTPPGTTLVDHRVPYILGGRLMWDTPLEGLRLGGSMQALRGDANYLIPSTPGGTPDTPYQASLRFLLWFASVEYTGHNLLLAAEGGLWRGDLIVNGAEMTRQVNERHYAMASYHVRPWFTPGVYYSGLFPWVDVRDGRQNYQHDIAATLRFDINHFWIVKLEGHYVLGTADLSTDLNGGANVTSSTLPREWLMFLAKTTVYF
ncbi:MAG TPA: hypothetical protein VGP07_21315 [Polyangia bacterium]